MTPPAKLGREYVPLRPLTFPAFALTLTTEFLVKKNGAALSFQIGTMQYLWATIIGSDPLQCVNSV
jgi:hypothetical protein